MFVGVPDPIAVGLVDSLARPGGNVTGTSTLTGAIYAKRIAVYKDLVPNISRIGLIIDKDVPRSSGIVCSCITAG